MDGAAGRRGPDDESGTGVQTRAGMSLNIQTKQGCTIRAIISQSRAGGLWIHSQRVYSVQTPWLHQRGRTGSRAVYSIPSGIFNVINGHF